MCEKCKALDEKIDHLQEVAKSVVDQKTLIGIDVLISDYRAQKRALHPETQMPNSPSSTPTVS